MCDDNRLPVDGHGPVGLPVLGSNQGTGFHRDGEDDMPFHRTNDDMDAYITSNTTKTLVSSASTSVVPGMGLGSSSPHFEQGKSPSFVPPARPSSTPFPLYNARSTRLCSEDDLDWDGDVEMSSDALLPSEHGHLTRCPGRRFQDLPTEVHEAILDYLFGYCVSPTLISNMKVSSLMRRWGTALRHCRRKELSGLALVSPVWRDLVQHRLYRHIKLRATIASVQDAIRHFESRPQLASFVRHIEMWFPVFEPKFGATARSNRLPLPALTPEGMTSEYMLPISNCSLDEVFRFVALVLPLAQVLTLEGGERRKAPQVVYFDPRRVAASVLPSLAPLPNIRTLVTRGQWNLIRDSDDFGAVLNALPKLREWQAAYSKPKSKSYISAAEFLPSLPMRIRSFSLSMESDYRRESSIPTFYAKVSGRTHICSRMAEVTSRLEHFSYTGRICHKFFDLAERSANPLTTRLRSIDITVKNCCRHSSEYHSSGSGIQELGFIKAFEKLVHSAVKTLDKFKEVQYLRIRFVDLDSVAPPLNPFFLYANGRCSGVWDDTIVAEMSRARPGVVFAEFKEEFGEISYTKDGRMIITQDFRGPRAVSLKMSNYHSLANRITIH